MCIQFTRGTTSINKKFTTPTPATNNNQGVAWDGEYLWLADNSPPGGTHGWIYKTLPDGTVKDFWQTPDDDPRNVEWDGTYLWSASNASKGVYQFTRDGTQKGFSVELLTEIH